MKLTDFITLLKATFTIDNRAKIVRINNPTDEQCKIAEGITEQIVDVKGKPWYPLVLHKDAHVLEYTRTGQLVENPDKTYNKNIIQLRVSTRVLGTADELNALTAE